jgi:hypothetical protein
MDLPLIEPERTGKGTYARGGPPGNKKALKQGYYSLVKLVKSRGGAMDKRTILGKMESDLGGDVSTAQKMLIQDVAIDTLLLLALQARLDVAPIRKGKIHPVYILREKLVAQRRETLKLLGLKRISRTLTWQELLQEERPADQGAAPAGLPLCLPPSRQAHKQLPAGIQGGMQAGGSLMASCRTT